MTDSLCMDFTTDVGEIMNASYHKKTKVLSYKSLVECHWNNQNLFQVQDYLQIFTRTFL